LIVSKIKNYWN